MVNVHQYIVDELAPRAVTSDEGLYQRQESQAAFTLPVVHRPFDAANPAHWQDRGRILDFLATAGSGSLLDFGPGDGWPSLLVAPFARHVTGVDAAPRRVAVCEANARRLGVDNFRCIHVPAGAPLPFPDNSFDGIMAASSLEQTPDPRATLQELHRVLKPGGRLRLRYEGLSRYRGGRENEVNAWESEPGVTQVLITRRLIEKEQAIYYGLQFHLPLSQLTERLTGGRELGVDSLTVEGLQRVRPWLTDAVHWVLVHPGCRTWLRWAGEIGFRCARSTHSGGSVARKVFDALADRPSDMAGVDRLLQPLVSACVDLEAPTDLDSPITLVK